MKKPESPQTITNSNALPGINDNNNTTHSMDNTENNNKLNFQKENNMSKFKQEEYDKLINESRIKYEQNDLDSATEVLGKAKLLQPNNPEPYVLECIFNTYSDNIEGAEKALLEGYKIDSKNNMIFRADGLLQERKGLFYEAIKKYKQAINIEPKDLNTILLLAMTLIYTGAFNEAFTYIKQAKKLDPTVPEIDYISGKYYTGISNINKAEEYHLSCYQKDPKHIENLVALADIYAELGNTQDLLKIAKDIANILPDENNLVNLLNIAQDAGDEETAKYATSELKKYFPMENDFLILPRIKNSNQ